MKHRLRLPGVALELRAAVGAALLRERLSLGAAAQRIGIHQSGLSWIHRASIERLLTLLAALGSEVDIVLRPAEKRGKVRVINRRRRG